MENISPTVIITIGVLVSFILLILSWLMPRTVSRHWKRHRAETVEQWEAEGVTFKRGPQGGQFCGLESMGVAKITRAIGFAAITETDLRVTRATPERVWAISFKQIKKVTIQPTFMGLTSKKAPFIVVRFTAQGKPDKLAFQVTEVEAWANDLAQLSKVRLQDLRH